MYLLSYYPPPSISNGDLPVVGFVALEAGSLLVVIFPNGLANDRNEGGGDELPVKLFGFCTCEPVLFAGIVGEETGGALAVSNGDDGAAKADGGREGEGNGIFKQNGKMSMLANGTSEHDINKVTIP